MTTDASANLEALFLEVLKKPEVERSEFLDIVCRDDDKLRAELADMLDAHEQAADFLERPAVRTEQTLLAHPMESPGTVIDRYKLLQLIGEGGFGAVYMAEQREPVKRRIALKIIKLGMDTKQVIARFEAERQALAMMDHPNIARVLDAGATETGRPYFVMELVKGVPINEYCDTENLSTKERLDLFITVCNAVQHAHQKGIIHRDLKPSNVMVTLHDGKPVPKVIDFGIAKATNRELTDKTLFTEYRQFIGTPEYMSPEQAEMSGLDIDTRSDIYSLGVLLYELLTGVTPFDGKRLRSAAINEVQRIIREEEPSRPSTRLSELSHALPSPLGRGAGGEGSTDSQESSIQYIVKHRRTDPGSLSKQLRGDLDWIIMKALEKDRSRRYDSANGFADDVQRHLDDEPVVAGPPSAAYRMSKFVRRNRTGVMTACAVLALLLAGIAGTTWGLFREQAAKQAESQQRQIAEKKTTEAQDNLRLAQAQEHKANASRDEAQKQKQQAGNAAHEARRQTYLANIFAADTAIQSNEIVAARNRLEAAPSEFRNWEWNYLHSALDQSIRPVLLEEGVQRHIIAISPDATRAVTQIVDGVHTIWNLDTGKPIAHFQREAELLEERPLAFSPDGTRIVAMLKDRNVSIWDTATGELAVILTRVTSAYLWASLSPDTTRIVTGTGTRMAHIWDAATGEKLAILDGLAYWAISATFSPDGTRIVTANWDGVAHIWDAATGEKLATLDGTVHGSGSGFFDFHVQCVSFSPDGTRIVTVSTNRTASMWDASTGAPLAVFPHDGHVRSASFSPDGTRIVTACGDKTARIWDAATGERLLVLRGHEEEVLTAAFNPDATRIVTASSDRTVRTWDAGNGEQLAVFLGHEHPVYSAAFTPDGTRIVSASDHAAHIWDATARDQLRVRGADTIPDGFGYAGIWSVSFSPDGRRIMTSPPYSSEQDRIWDAATGEQLAALHRPAGKSGGPPSFSPDGTRIVDSHNQSYAIYVDGPGFGRGHIWDAITGEQVGMLSEHESVRRASFTPDGTRIVMSAGGTTLFFDAATGEELPLPRRYNNIGPASFSPDGTKIFTFSRDDMSFHIRDAATGEQLAVLDGPHDSMRSPSFSPDATRIVTIAEDNTARIWDAATGKQLFVLRGHDDEMNSATFSPDGTRIVTTSQDNTARIWDVTTGEQLLVLRGHEVAVKRASFSPDGTRIVTGHDMTIRIWDGIPYAQRYRAKRALKDAEPEAVRVLDTVTATAPQRDGAPDLRAVAESIRTDPAIDEVVRHVALNLLMHRAGPIQSKANNLIDELKAQFVFAADIREAVQADSSLEPAARAAAINSARWIEDSPGRLYYWASQVVKDDDRSPADYAQAQRAATFAFQSDSTSQHFARTSAKTWTRLQKPDKAIEVWREHVDQMRAGTPTGGWNLTDALFKYGEALLKNDQAKDAELVLRECLSIFEKHKERWWTPKKEIRRVLGECLTKLARFTEAEPILVELANAELEDEVATEESTNEAIQRVVDLYEAWHAAEPGQGYDAKADQWRAKLPVVESADEQDD